MQKNYIWNSAACSCKNDKYLKSITNDSVTTCNENIDTTKTVPANFIEKKVACETKNFYILLIFLLIAIALLIAVSIYYYLVQHWTKQKHLWQYHVTIVKFKEINWKRKKSD